MLLYIQYVIFIEVNFLCEQDYLTKPAVTGGMDHEYAEILDPETRLETPEETPEPETVSTTEPECSVCSEPGPDSSLHPVISLC